MRTYLLPETGHFYKANLHCHTTVSDGKKTPEEIKELYMKKGYSIVAYTDHNAFIPHNDLTDENFLALNGMEMDIVNNYGNHEEYEVARCDLSLIALDPSIVYQPLWHRKMYQDNLRDEIKAMIQIDENESNYRRTYEIGAISYLMQTARKKGFYVILNHPTRSRERYVNYTRYEGMHAIEMLNGDSIRTGHDEYNTRIYDDILNTGKRIYGVAGDENRNFAPDESRYSDSGWAFTMIKAQTLDYASVADALEKGYFYVSEGPEIYELYVEDGKIHVKCSEAVHITCTSQHRVGQRIVTELGQEVTEAVFRVQPEWGRFRITVRDKRGRLAYTNAYLPEDWM